MKRFILLLTTTLSVNIAFAQNKFANVYTSDIDNFWKAYDRITATAATDSARQYQLLNQLFLNKGTPGLKAMMQVRNYTSKDYISAINHYPDFWKSIRPNMRKAKQFAADIAKNAERLKVLYPSLKPAPIYFTVGAFRSGGTTLNGQVLIGSEITLADEHTVTSEFPASYSNLATFFKTNPINSVVFTNVHEYVHTQQKTTNANTLLGQCVLEGVAEFMAEKATGQASTLPAIAYGQSHTDRIRQVFTQQLFNATNGFWLYNDAATEFPVRDLGYYVGYAICDKYYSQAADKKQAIREMIELDYDNETALSHFLDQSGYFATPVQALKADYEQSRPVVMGLAPFTNNDNQVAPSTTQLFIIFSKPMNKNRRGFELGPLGKDNLLRIKRLISFSDDGRTATFEIELKPSQHYQIVVSERFRDMNDVSIKPYLIDFTTAAQ